MSAGPQRSSGPIFVSWIKMVEAFRDEPTRRRSCSLIAKTETQVSSLFTEKSTRADESTARVW